MIDLRVGTERTPGERVRTLPGANLPEANRSTPVSGGAILWLGPDQWLLVAEAAPDLPGLRAIPGGTATDVSHARVAVRLSGARAIDVLSKGCMLDLHAAVFPDGACAQTAIAKIPVIIHRITNGAFDLYAPRSYARSLWHWLEGAADEYGYYVGRSP